MSESSLINKLLPDTASNDYKGHLVAYYAFVFLTAITLIRSVIHIVAPDGGAQSIATINLAVEGGPIIVGLFAQWGLIQLLLGVVFLVVAVRYRNLIPLMYTFIITENIARLLLGFWKPLGTQTLASGAIGSLLLPPIAILLLLLSLQTTHATITSKTEK
jgi:hypothetical protein